MAERLFEHLEFKPEFLLKILLKLFSNVFLFFFIFYLDSAKSVVIYVTWHLKCNQIFNTQGTKSRNLRQVKKNKNPTCTQSVSKVVVALLGTNWFQLATFNYMPGMSDI